MFSSEKKKNSILLPLAGCHCWAWKCKQLIKLLKLQMNFETVNWGGKSMYGRCDALAKCQWQSIHEHISVESQWTGRTEYHRNDISLHLASLRYVECLWTCELSIWHGASLRYGICTQCTHHSVRCEMSVHLYGSKHTGWLAVFVLVFEPNRTRVHIRWFLVWHALQWGN